jgi:hypothetical protein
MLILGQRDSRWKDEKIGTTHLTIGRWGCTITCLSMLSDYFNGFKTPRFLAKYLKYTKEGLIIWDSLPSILPFKLEKRLYKRNDEEIKKSLSDPERAVILQVDGCHWVLALGYYKLAPSIYRIADPFFGDKSTSLRYKKITGSAHMILKK